MKYQSAAVPYRHNSAEGLQVLLVTSRRRGRWVLPKGKVKKGLTPHASAALEAFEEGGVLGTAHNLPVGTYRQRKVMADGKVVVVSIAAFAMPVDSELQNWPEKSVRRRRWVNLDEAINSVRDINIRTLLRSFRDSVAAADELSNK